MLQFALRRDRVIDIFLLEHEQNRDAGEIEHLLRDGKGGVGVL